MRSGEHDGWSPAIVSAKGGQRTGERGWRLDFNVSMRIPDAHPAGYPERGPAPRLRT